MDVTALVICLCQKWHCVKLADCQTTMENTTHHNKQNTTTTNTNTTTITITTSTTTNNKVNVKLEGMDDLMNE